MARSWRELTRANCLSLILFLGLLQFCFANYYVDTLDFKLRVESYGDLAVHDDKIRSRRATQSDAWILQVQTMNMSK